MQKKEEGLHLADAKFALFWDQCPSFRRKDGQKWVSPSFAVILGIELISYVTLSTGTNT